MFYGTDDHGNGLVARVRRHYGDVAEGQIFLSLEDGRTLAGNDDSGSKLNSVQNVC